MALHVPHLQHKLAILFAGNGPVRSQKQLADYLGIGPNNISIWCKGQPPYRPPDMVPNHHVGELCRLFGIDRDLLQRSLEEFEREIKCRSNGEGAWQRLLQGADSRPGVELLRRQAASRGLAYPAGEETDSLPRFQAGEEVVLRVDLEALWPGPKGKAVAEIFALLVHRDPEGYQLVAPCRQAPLRPLRRTDSPLLVPPPDHKGRARYLQITGPRGIQTSYAVLCAGPLAPLGRLSESDGGDALAMDVLDEVADHLLAPGAPPWSLGRLSFAVY